jgi:hypothetical protein
MFAACDGNFKLRRTSVSSEERDLSLYDGLAYFVPLAMYKEWMEKNKGVRQEVMFRSYVVRGWTNIPSVVQQLCLA